MVMIGAVAMMAFTAATFADRPEFGHFADAGAVATGIARYVGEVPGVLFALALIDACIIGAAAVSLATAYAVGDVLDFGHSLHKKPSQSKAAYAIYCGLIALAAALVLIPGTPLGLLTNAVQSLAGVLLPSATVFLLLLCNDEAVLGPWVNGRWYNLFTGGVIAVLIVLSLILTASVLFPDVGEGTILGVLAAGGGIAAAAWVASGPSRAGERVSPAAAKARLETWRMPPLAELPPRRLSLRERLWLIVLRGYLLVAGGLVFLRIAQLAIRGL
jgi:hypothetical protein